jgi:hypothetical protein
MNRVIDHVLTWPKETNGSATALHRRADAFITAAVHSPHVKLHRQSGQRWLGDFDSDPLPSAEALIKQATVE